MKAFIAVPKNTPRETIEQMRAFAIEAGFEPLFAADVEPQKRKGTPNDNTLACFHAVRQAMQASDVIIANLTPFIGVEPDPDVTFQWGYMAAQRKPAFSYLNTSTPFCDRVREWNQAEFTEETQIGPSGETAILKRDRDQMRIENMGIKDRTAQTDNPGPDNYHNLMLEGPSMKTGSTVLTPEIAGVTVSPEHLYTNLALFQKSLADAKRMVIEKGKTHADAPPEKLETANAAYLAGPDVFLPDLYDHFDRKKRFVDPLGIYGIAPVDAQMDFGAMQKLKNPENGNNPRMRELIYEGDTGVMQSVRMGLFNLTPFHGATADSGTIFEMGYMVGKDDALGRKPMVFGYSNDGNNLMKRIAVWNGQPNGPNYGGHEAGFSFGDAVHSPMIDGAILASGGALTHRCAAKGEERFSALTEFFNVAREAAKVLRTRGLNEGVQGRAVT